MGEDTLRESLEKEIKRYITEYATKRGEYYIEQYTLDLKGKMREAVAKACIEIFRVTTLYMLGEELRIVIKDLSKGDQQGGE